jgi:hypothetical protein
MFHVIDITIVDLYIMYRAHMIPLGKWVKTMPHLKWNVALPRALRKKRGTHSIPKARAMVGAYAPNLGRLHYSMQWTQTSRRKRLYVVCKNKVN